MHLIFRSDLWMLGTLSILTIPAHAQSNERHEAKGAWGGRTDGHGAYANVNGIILYYETSGSGRPLILLHGGLGALEMFGPNLTALAKGRQVIAVDLQGHGRTADIDRPLSVESMAEDIAALIHHLGLQRTDIMGYSIGGEVALLVASHHPDLIDRAVLVSTPIRRDAFYPEILAQQAQVGAAAAEAMHDTPIYQLYASIAPRPQDFPRLLDKLGAAMKVDFDFTNDVPRVTAPTLVVAGDADIFPPRYAVELFGLLGGGKRDGRWDGSGRGQSRLAILPGLTHYTIFNAPALASTVIPFLDDSTRQPR